MYMVSNYIARIHDDDVLDELGFTEPAVLHVVTEIVRDDRDGDFHSSIIDVDFEDKRWDGDYEALHEALLYDGLYLETLDESIAAAREASEGPEYDKYDTLDP